MLTAQQVAHFETFGFLFLRWRFSPEEMVAITREADALWAEDRQARPDLGEHRIVAPFIEKRPLLSQLADDDRIYGPIEQLLGPGFIWSGSQGGKGSINAKNEHGWHADRPGESEISYKRIKVMIYLEPTTKETGALRVIPGSHRMPFHKALEPLQRQHQKDGTTADTFGVAGVDIPAFPLESNPGDLVFFHQGLYHAVYGSFGNRHYIGLRYAAKPTTTEYIASLRRLSPYTFQPDAAFLNSDRPRIRGMVAGLVELGKK